MKKFFCLTKYLPCLLCLFSFVVNADTLPQELYKSAGAMLTNPNLTVQQINSINNSAGTDLYSKPIDFLVVKKDYETQNLDISQVISNQDKISLSTLSSHINDANHHIQLAEEHYFRINNGNYPKAYADLIDDIAALGESGGILLLNRVDFKFEGGDTYGGSSTQVALGYALCKKLLSGTEKEKAIIRYNFGDDISCFDRHGYGKDEYGNGSDMHCSEGGCTDNYWHRYDFFGDPNAGLKYYQKASNMNFLSHVPPYNDVHGFYVSIGWLVKMFGVSSNDLSKRTVEFGWNIDENELKNLDKLSIYTSINASYVPDLVYTSIHDGSTPYSFEKSLNNIKSQEQNVKVILLNVNPSYYAGLMKDPDMYGRLNKDNVIGIAYKNIWPEKQGNYKNYKSPWAKYETLWGFQ